MEVSNRSVAASLRKLLSAIFRTKLRTLRFSFTRTGNEAAYITFLAPGKKSSPHEQNSAIPILTAAASFSSIDEEASQSLELQRPKHSTGYR